MKRKNSQGTTHDKPQSAMAALAGAREVVKSAKKRVKDAKAVLKAAREDLKAAKKAKKAAEARREAQLAKRTARVRRASVAKKAASVKNPPRRKIAALRVRPQPGPVSGVAPMAQSEERAAIAGQTPAEADPVDQNRVRTT